MILLRTAALAALLLPALPALADVVWDGENLSVDGVRFPRDTVLTVTGPVESTDSMRLRFSAGKAILTGMRLNGKGNQDGVEFHLLTPKDPGKLSVKQGQWYETKGKWQDVKISGVIKILTFAVEAIRPVEASPLKPADFANRACRFQGEAIRGGRLSLPGGPVRLESMAEWPQQAMGKRIEVRGLLRKSETGWIMEKPAWQFVRLEDQLDREVNLEGSLWSLNGVWWFDCRGTSICLTGEKGPGLDFPADSHGRTARVTGRLIRQLRPSLDQISLKQDRDLVPTFVIRGAKFDYMEPAIADDERFRAVYDKPVPFRDGVPVLVAESSYRLNMMGNETRAMLYHERNDAAIRAFLKAPTNAQVQVLAGRMQEAKDVPAMRLLYAAMLAACNDGRGRDALLAALEDPAAPQFAEALYCTGIVPFMPPEGSALRPETAWAEDALIRILADRKSPDGKKEAQDDVAFDFDRAQSASPAGKAAYCSSVIEFLLKSASPKGRAAVLDLALSDSSGSAEAIHALCRNPAPLALADLHKLATATAKRKHCRRQVLEKFLDQKEPAVVSVSREDLADSFIYMEFRESMTPEIAAALHAELPNYSGEALTHARMLAALSAKDPAQEVIALLNDANWTDKNLAVWELKRLKDPRGLDSLVRALREAPKGFFKSDSTFGSAPGITNALDAIAAIGSDKAVEALLGFLDAPFGRAREDYMNDAGIHRIVAAHLIDLTGESFGVNAPAWRKWFRTRAAKRTSGQ